MGLRWAFLLLVAALFALGLSVLRWHDPSQPHAFPDTFRYARQAELYAGASPSQATLLAALLTCRDRQKSGLFQPDPCDPRVAAAAPRMPQRYERIFSSRPGYPLGAAPFVRLLGAWRGMVAVTLGLQVLCGLLLFATAVRAGLSWPQGLLAEALYFLLPTGLWGTRVLTEGASAAGLIALLFGVVLMRRWRTLGLAVISGSLAWLFLVKSSVGFAAAVFLATGILLVILARLLFRTRPEAHDVYLLGLLGLVILVMVAVGALMQMPGLNDTLQDLFTFHFTTPDVPDPYQRWWELSWQLWPDQLRQVFKGSQALLVALAAVASVALFRWDRRLAVATLAVGLTGLAAVLVHPVLSEAPRLLSPIWILAALGLATLRTGKRDVGKEGDWWPAIYGVARRLQRPGRYAAGNEDP